MEAKRATALKWVNIAVFVVMVAANALANLLRLGGVTTGGVSEQYPNLFTPAAATFAIWGAIYLLLAGFVLYQAGLFGGGAGRGAETAERVGAWFAVSCLLNVAWLVSWHYRLIELSFVLMLGLLATLARLRRQTLRPPATKQELWLGQAPFGLYFGWITVATMANACVLLVKWGWNGWGITPQNWMVILLVIGALIACAACLRNRDWVYGIAVIWAYAGILFQHASPKGFGGAYPPVIIAAALCEVALISVAVWAFEKRRK